MNAEEEMFLVNLKIQFDEPHYLTRQIMQQTIIEMTAQNKQICYANNKKIRCLVIDDEPPAREMLKQHIAGVESLELAVPAAMQLKPSNFLKDHPVDLLFLDIQMPQLLGTNFIRTLKTSA